MKPKRIKALVRYIDADGFVWVSHKLARTNNVASEPCYVLRQSGIRALAERMDKRYWDNRHFDQTTAESMLAALRSVGITPGRVRKGAR